MVETVYNVYIVRSQLRCMLTWNRQHVDLVNLLTSDAPR